MHSSLVGVQTLDLSSVPLFNSSHSFFIENIPLIFFMLLDHDTSVSLKTHGPEGVGSSEGVSGGRVSTSPAPSGSAESVVGTDAAAARRRGRQLMLRAHPRSSMEVLVDVLGTCSVSSLPTGQLIAIA